MEIIDAHAHIYPSKIAKKATEAIGDFYDIKMQMPEGSPERLLEEGKSAGVSRFLVHSCATKLEQVSHINDFIYEQLNLHPEFIGFMTLHQDMTENQVIDEMTKCKERGFYGVKLHPDFQRFDIDDVNVHKFYRVAESLGFAFLFHTGDDRYDYSAPEKLAKVAKLFPKVNFIGAHFGGYRCWDRVACYEGIDNVYFDTCSALPFISPEFATSLIKKFGADKFFFGTDFPMWDAKEEIERFNKLSLTDTEREKIFSANLKELLKIE